MTSPLPGSVIAGLASRLDVPMDSMPYETPPAALALSEQIADEFDRAPLYSCDDGLSVAYAKLRQQSLFLFESIIDAGLKVRPWRASGVPYHRSRELIRDVVDNGSIWVYLTRTGHGRDGTTSQHPLRGSSGIVCDDVPLEHNDIFRVVHDILGHVLPHSNFSLSGELRAAYCQMLHYPLQARRVLFTENVAQICWFYSGRHLRQGNAPLPAERPYPAQKIYRCSDELFGRFLGAFDHQPQGERDDR